MANEVTSYEQKWSAAADEYAGEEKISGGFIYTRGGILSVGEDELPGNQMAVVILDSIRENTYYPGEFNAGNLLPPVCFAFGRSESEMFPHEGMQVAGYFKPQSVGEDGAVQGCSACPQNAYGTADTGRGKACSNRRRIAVIPAGVYTKKRGSKDYELELFEDPKHYQETEILHMKLPVTSAKAWAKYVNMLAGEYRRPPYAVITRVALEPDAKTQFRVTFELIEEIPVSMAEVLGARHEEARNGIAQPYAPPSPEQLEPRQQKSRLRR